MYVQFLGDSGNSPDAKLVFSADLLEKLHLCSPLQRVPPLRAIARLKSTRSSGGWAKLNCRSGPIQNTEIRYTTAEMLTTLKRRVEVLQPDIVICYEATNDLSSDRRKLAEERGLRPATGKGEGLSRLASYSMLLTIAELNIKII